MFALDIDSDRVRGPVGRVREDEKDEGGTGATDTGAAL